MMAFCFIELFYYIKIGITKGNGARRLLLIGQYNSEHVKRGLRQSIYVAVLILSCV